MHGTRGVAVSGGLTPNPPKLCSSPATIRQIPQSIHGAQPVSSASSRQLNEKEAKAILAAMQDEVFTIFVSHLQKYYVNSWDHYRLSANSTDPTSAESIRKLCETMTDDMRQCVEKERVSVACSHFHQVVEESTDSEHFSNTSGWNRKVAASLTRRTYGLQKQGH
jgi:hypothetical protein